MEIIKNLICKINTDSLVAVGLIVILAIATYLGQERLCDTLAAGLVGFLGRSAIRKE